MISNPILLFKLIKGATGCDSVKHFVTAVHFRQGAKSSVIKLVNSIKDINLA